MKKILNLVKCLAALAILTLGVGCATDSHSKQDMLIAAGFKVITPVKPDQVALLATLPDDKVAHITYKGKTYYVMPDKEHNQAYVGGPKQYQSYQQLRIAKQLSNENLEAAQMNQWASMNWGAWGNWGGWGVGSWY
jgi:hypothetical protein